MDGFELEMDAGAAADHAGPAAVVPARVDRVRAVLANRSRFLLVQHESKRRENAGKWALPGGRLKVREEPKSGLRRELHEELAIWVPKLTPLGEWIRVGECQRVYGCEIDDAPPSPQPDEIAAIAWLEYDDVVRLATERRLRWGFELAAINVFQRLAR